MELDTDSMVHESSTHIFLCFNLLASIITTQQPDNFYGAAISTTEDPRIWCHSRQLKYRHIYHETFLYNRHMSAFLSVFRQKRTAHLNQVFKFSIEVDNKYQYKFCVKQISV